MSERAPHTPRIFVALGSNLDDPLHQVKAALAALDRHRAIDLCAVSGLYSTPPWGNPDQPAFVNAVAEVCTALAPTALLAVLQRYEQQAGRVREQRWGPRVIDLDLLAYGQCVWRTRSLRLPHPGIAERAFVLLPWADIAPDYSLPGLGRIHELLAKCPGIESIKPIEEV